MSTTMKTPGVYIQELDAFGNAVVPVPTAVPAFIGYTEKTSYNGKSLVNSPVRITSLSQFRTIFEDKDASKRPQIEFDVIVHPVVSMGATKLFLGKAAPDSDENIGSGGDLYLDTEAKKLYRQPAVWPKTADGLLSGSGAPTNDLGANGNVYLDVDSGTVYGPKKSGAWAAATDILSGSGAPENSNGEVGANYVDTAGKVLYGPKTDGKWNDSSTTLSNGSGAPADTAGNVGEYYLDNDTSILYGPKKAATWPEQTKDLLTGTEAPDASLGKAGDYYIDTDANKIYGPKEDGQEWAENANIANGATPPGQAVGATGDFYVDTDEKKVYGPKGADHWLKDGVSVKTPEPDYQFNNEDYYITSKDRIHRLHSAMRFFYANGGSECYVLSVGGVNADLDADAITQAIDHLKKESEPTMLVIPDLVEFDEEEAYSLQGHMINHCGYDMASRVAILDIPGGYNEPLDQPTQSVDKFRNSVGGTLQKSNSYAAAYYPWLHTTVYQPADVSYRNITSSSYAKIAEILTAEFTGKDGVSEEHENVISCFINDNGISNDKRMNISGADAAMQNLSKQYPRLLDKIRKRMNLMAPSAAIAGVYSAVDDAEGVWKAPANVALQNVITPAVKINHEMQENLNVPLSGKSVCAIRAFKGMGNMVWGARTMDGNSNDWRYVNVRRTLIYLEQSIKEAAKAYVFAPNDATTWVNVKSMISSFLTGVWKQGGLVGPKPADAFSVSVGLGTTMTNDDIQQGIMRVMVKVAVSHPAEFIEITFQQQMQKA